MSLEALKDALRTSLEQTGSLQEAKARLRADVFAALNGEGGVVGANAQTVQASPHNMVLNELIAEYLAYNGYYHTLSVFVPETGSPSDRIPPEVLRSQLKLPSPHPEASSLPILYQTLALMQEPLPADRNHDKDFVIHADPSSSSSHHHVYQEETLYADDSSSFDALASPSEYDPFANISIPDHIAFE